MAGTFTIDLDELPDELSDSVDEHLRDISVELINQLKVESPVGATGDLQGSFQILERGDNRYVVGSPISYAHAVYTGRGPHTPDFDNLQVWARRKLGDESLAGPVFRSIQRHGTSENRYIDRAIDTTMDKFK